MGVTIMETGLVMVGVPVAAGALYLLGYLLYSSIVALFGKYDRDVGASALYLVMFMIMLGFVLMLAGLLVIAFGRS